MKQRSEKGLKMSNFTIYNAIERMRSEGDILNRF